MNKKPLTDTEKARILTMREDHVTVKDICSRTGRSKSTVLRLLSASKKLPPNTIPKHKTRSGCKKKAISATDRFLKKSVIFNPFITARQLKSMYPDLLRNVSDRTVRHRLQNDLNMPSRAAARKPLLNDRMKKKRLLFAMRHKDWTEEQWLEVMWSDESTFHVIRSTRGRLRRPLGSDRYSPKYTVKTVKHSPSVMVWGCFRS